jgi:hypothetical protein
MSSNEQIEALMLRFFPVCPLCGANKGYYVPFAKNSIECKACHARWISDDFEKCDDLVKLRLKNPSNGGKGNTLLYKDKPVDFWRNYHQIEQTEKEIRELENPPEKIEKIEEMRCPVCDSLMECSSITFRVGGWSGKANVASDLFVSPLLTKVGQVQEKLLPVLVYFCVKCGKMEFIATQKTRGMLLRDQ